MRNHYANTSVAQEFYVWDEKYQVGMRENLRIRYSLLRYFYTLLYKSSIFGDPMIRHPMYEWPSVDDMVNNKDSFLIGPAIRMTANFDISNSPKDFSSSFAQGRYLEYRSYQITEVKKAVETVKLYNGWDYPNVHIIEGNIVPFQDTSVTSGVTRTYDLLNKQMRILVFPNSGGYAKGNLYISRGEKYTDQEQYFSLIHAEKAIKVVFERGQITDKGKELNEVLEEIHIVGTDDVGKADFACAMDKDGNIRPFSIETVTRSDNQVKYLRIYGGVTTIEFDMIDTIFYGKKGQDYNYCDKIYNAYAVSEGPTQATYR